MDEFALGHDLDGLETAAEILRREWGEPPDLLEEELLGDRDRSWVEPVHEVLADRQGRQDRRGRVHLDFCEFRSGPGGWLGLAATDQGTGRTVRRGDLVSAGFGALHDRDGTLHVWPRIYRMVCANGAIVEAGVGETRVSEPETVAEHVREALEPEVFDKTSRLLRSAASIPIDDPAEVLARARALTPVPVVLSEWGVDGDRTAWSLVNIVTANARNESSAPRRFELEKDAGRILEVALAMAPGEPVGV
jgi:hypothetical protein